MPEVVRLVMQVIREVRTAANEAMREITEAMEQESPSQSPRGSMSPAPRIFNRGLPMTNPARAMLNRGPNLINPARPTATPG